jgi:hypothetical protein
MVVGSNLDANLPRLTLHDQPLEGFVGDASHGIFGTGCHFSVGFHPPLRPSGLENPPNRPLFPEFQPVCVKYGQSVEWMTRYEIVGLKGSSYEKVMDAGFGRQPVDDR